MKVRDSVAGGAYSIATLSPAASSANRRAPPKPAASSIGFSNLTIAAARNSPMNHRATAASSSAIQRHTGVSRISKVTSTCGNFFSKGVSATAWWASGIRATLDAETTQMRFPGRGSTRCQLQNNLLPVHFEGS